MFVRLLGTAAGGGFPQWNCACTGCTTARRDPDRARRRTQSSTAISGDGRQWFLLNASPDVAAQIESFAPLRTAAAVRGSNIASVLLTNADLDHVLGLFVLRENGRLVVHATPPVRRSLEEGLRMGQVLEPYGGIEWREPPVTSWPVPLRCADGADSGLDYTAFRVPGKPPRYRPQASAEPGDAVGYRFVDRQTGGRLVYVPELGGIDRDVLEQLMLADAVLVDGTFWSEDEMSAGGTGGGTAAGMGHLPVGGAGGSLAVIAALPARLKVYTHMNNTNPMLLEDSSQRRQVREAGVIVGEDGYSFEL